jgi:hypothetical protein
MGIGLGDAPRLRPVPVLGLWHDRAVGMTGEPMDS